MLLFVKFVKTSSHEKELVWYFDEHDHITKYKNDLLNIILINLCAISYVIIIGRLATTSKSIVDGVFPV